MYGKQMVSHSCCRLSLVGVPLWPSKGDCSSVDIVALINVCFLFFFIQEGGPVQDLLPNDTHSRTKA